MITSKGVGFLVAALVLFLLARLTQVGWLYLVDAVLWGIILLSAVFPWVGVAFLAAQRSLERPDAKQGRAEPAEGDPVRIKVTVRPRAPWPSYVLSLFYDCPLTAPGARLHRFFVTVVSKSKKVSMVSTFEAYQRGRHYLGPLVAESSAPFGLFRRRVRLAAPEPVLVYPKVYPLQRMALADGVSGTAPHSRKSRTGIDVAGSRSYLPGDPQRHIHWRNTARFGRLMVKEFEDPADCTLYLVFDATHVWGEGKETTLEYGIKVVASVADYAARHQIPVRVMGGGLHGTESGPREIGAPRAAFSGPSLLENLALVTPGDGLGLSETLAQLPPGSSALVAVSGDDATGVQAILHAAPKLHRLVVVAFEEFGEPRTDGEALKSLRLARIPVARCAKGNLADALQALGNLNGPSSFTQMPSASLGTGGQAPQASTIGNGSTGPAASVTNERQPR
jgi:uncharacterized protein (DUF58 family)